MDPDNSYIKTKKMSPLTWLLFIVPDEDYSDESKKLTSSKKKHNLRFF